MEIEEESLIYLDEKKNSLVNLSKAIWHHPELALEEDFASRQLISMLEQHGFKITKGVGHMPTSFIACWGSGKPIIGILGEYDALPELSQKVSTRRDPVVSGGPGHGCGHNLLGVGSAGAAIAVKMALERTGVKGTIKFYGCPAEETLIGKVFMAREKVFHGLDAAITWHPYYPNSVWWSSSNAMNSFKANFYGIPAHAGSAPEAGRSALDAAILTDVGINYLREHIIQEARLHGIITNGGSAPNIVPGVSQIWYYVRAPQRDQVERIYKRVLNIIEGAALMTGTKHNVELITGVYNYLPNEAIGSLMLEKLKKVGPPIFTDEEKIFARALWSTIAQNKLKETIMNDSLQPKTVGGSLCEKIYDECEELPCNKRQTVKGSTDVGDVSYITPTGQLSVCCMPFGVPNHSWQSTASFGSNIGFKGMMVAAKALTLTALDLINKPHLLESAAEEFRKRTGGVKEYKTSLREKSAAY